MRIPITPTDTPIHQINPAKQPKRYGNDEEEEGEEQPTREESQEEEPKKTPPRRPQRKKDGPGIDVVV